MKKEKAAQRLVQVAFVASVALVWHFTTASGRVSPLLLPPLGSVWRELAALIDSAQFWPDLRVTLYELMLAFLIAAVTGTVTGYAVSRSSYAVRVFDPLFAGMYAIPAILLFPLYVLFFGLGAGSKIAIGATIAFFPVVLNTITGLGQVNPAYVAAARSMGASAAQMFWCVMLPASLPVIVTGLRIGVISAFMAVLGGETIASFAGMGHRIVELAENMDTARMFANIILVMFIALLLNAVVALAEGSGRKV